MGDAAAAPPQPSPNVSGLTPRATAIACAVLLTLFATLAWLAASTKSATYDEVLHAPAAYSHLRHFDFRANPEHPPLWKYWAALPWLLSPPAEGSVVGPLFDAIPDEPATQWAWGQHVLYHTPGNDASHLIGMSRAMMLAVAVAMGAFLARWGWRLGGPVAALVTTALFCLDPTVLAHSALVTNDVAFSFTAVAVAWALWRVGDRLTPGRALAVAFLCGVSITTKFTGILLIPGVALTLLTRTLLPDPWLTWRGLPATIATRAAGAATVFALTLLVTYACIWAAYGFRAAISPDPAVHPNVPHMVAETAVNEIMQQTGHPATRAELRAWQPSPYVKTVLWALAHHVLPDAFLSGLSFAYAKSLFRNAFLFGDIRATGWWYYFPAAMLVKLPLATLATIIALPVTLFFARTAAPNDRRRGAWIAACLLIPAGVIAIASVRSHMNIGIRHFLPAYVFCYIAAGVAAARLANRWPRATRTTLADLAIALAADSLCAFPNFIPFFNVAAGGSRGGIHLLGDSNLDWGQDLPLVADWQRAHPDRTLHLAYFGTADPDYYGIRADRLTADNGLTMPASIPTSGVIAVSATTLQGLWLAQGQPNPFAPLLARRPAAILGGSMYVYDLGGQ